MKKGYIIKSECGLCLDNFYHWTEPEKPVNDLFFHYSAPKNTEAWDVKPHMIFHAEYSPETGVTVTGEGMRC